MLQVDIKKTNNQGTPPQPNNNGRLNSHHPIVIYVSDARSVSTHTQIYVYIYIYTHHSNTYAFISRESGPHETYIEDNLVFYEKDRIKTYPPL